jgi:L-ascorbate metabolism protein UlaG (beta-lactamase superfamily)
MENVKKIEIKRYNIYSGLELKTQDISICIDPAKIVPDELELLNPNMILISHESMDHMDPTQVYRLQKRQNCKIFCSIAVAVDLYQYYESDVDFIDSINVLVPGSKAIYRDIQITAGKSEHCDYMLPLVFRIDFLKYNFSVLHCIDTLLSDEIVKLSNGTDIGIIPLGIAKGINAQLGVTFLKKLGSYIYITNHFTNQLSEFMQLVGNDNLEKLLPIKIMPIDWNEECTILGSELRTKSASAYNSNDYRVLSLEDLILKLNDQENLEQNLRLLIAEINLRKGELLQKSLFEKMEDIYKEANPVCKTLILIIFTMVSLFDFSLIKESFIECLKVDLQTKTTPIRDDFKATLLFFLGVHAQRSSMIFNLKDVMSNLDVNHEHVSYWIVECLGRMAVSKNQESSLALKHLKDIVKEEKLYNSIVVRRKIFWEFYRLTKFSPVYSQEFIVYYAKGLNDFNPDVRLLTLLCIGILSRTNNILSEEFINTVSELYNDIEDDVRETLARIFGVIDRFYHHLAIKNKEKIRLLLHDKNCHVRRATIETLLQMEN